MPRTLAATLYVGSAMGALAICALGAALTTFAAILWTVGVLR